jgi:glucose-1-phosphate thymidylyltransferase
LAYLERGQLQVSLMDRGVAWLDSGTHDSLLDASNFVATVEHRQSIKIACLEEVALRSGFLDRPRLRAIVDGMPDSSYREYLERVLDER